MKTDVIAIKHKKRYEEKKSELKDVKNGIKSLSSVLKNRKGSEGQTGQGHGC